MAKLYWRVKKDGRWTWSPAVSVGLDERGYLLVIREDVE